MVDVCEIRPGVKDAEDDVIVEIAVIDVRRIVGEKGHGRFAPSLRQRNSLAGRGLKRWRRRRLAGTGFRWTDRACRECRRCGRFDVRLVGSRSGRIGRIVDHHGRVAHRPRRQEELLEFAFDTGRLGRTRRSGIWSDVHPVGQNLAADAARTVVDGEIVLPGAERVGISSVRLCDVVVDEGLHGVDNLVIDDRKFAEGLPPVGRRGNRIELRSVCREVPLVRSRDERGQVRVIRRERSRLHDALTVDHSRRLRNHLQDRPAGLRRVRSRGRRVVGRIPLRVSNHRLLQRGRGGSRRRKPHVGGRHLAAIELRAGRFHIYSAEKTGSQLAAALGATAGHRRGGVGEERPDLRRVERVGEAISGLAIWCGRNKTGLVQARKRAVVLDASNDLHTAGVKRNVRRRRL